MVTYGCDLQTAWFFGCLSSLDLAWIWLERPQKSNNEKKVLHKALNTCGGVKSQRIRFLTSVLDRDKMSHFVMTVWPWREQNPLSMNRSLGWPQNRNGHDECTNQCHCRELNPRRKKTPMRGWDISPNVLMCLLLLWRNSPTRARAASFLKFLYRTQWHNTVGRTSLHERSARRRDLYLTTLTTDRLPCPCGTRTRNHSKRSAADTLLRPLGHWDRHYNVSASK